MLFTRQGKFHSKIEVNKISPGAKPLYQFYFDKKTNLIEIPVKSENYFYDTDARLVNKTINKKPAGLFGVFKASIEDKYTAYFNADSQTNKDSVKYELTLYDEDKLIKKFLPYNINYKMEAMDQASFKNFSQDFKTSNGIYYLHNYDYNVYWLTAGSIKPVYQFIFPLQNSLPKDFTINPVYNNKRMAIANSDTNIVVRLFNFYKKDDLLFVSTNKFSYIFNTQSNQLICESKIVSDSLSYFLPITQAEVNGRDGYGLLNFDGENFYTSYSSLILFDQMDSTKNKQPAYPPALAAYLHDKKNIQGNPVLVQIKFKSTL